MCLLGITSSLTDRRKSRKKVIHVGEVHKGYVLYLTDETNIDIVSRKQILHENTSNKNIQQYEKNEIFEASQRVVSIKVIICL
jgi:hypothetical protein